jgi:SARP family transcriptional regulator, regulator of embCAB operon
MPEPRTGGTPALRFQLLGPVRAWRDGVEVDLGPAKQRAVLAVLLVQAGRPVATTRIVDAVWQDRPPKNGPNVVQKYVAGLRRVLDPDRPPRSPGQVLGWSDAGYVLHAEPGSVDVDEFARMVRDADGMRRRGQLAGASAALRGALGLWRAEALAGLTGPSFDDTRERLSADRADAFERWADVEIALGNHAAVIPELARMVTELPLRERLRHLLVLALYRSGRQAEALAAYHDARRYLDDELGIEPGEQLKALHLAILRGEPAPGEQDSRRIVAAVPVAPTGPPPAALAGPTPAFGPPAAALAPPPFLPIPGPPALPAPATTGAADRRWRHRLGQLVAALIPLLTFGVASWAVVAFLAVRRRSWPHGLAAVGYFALIAFVFIALGHGPDDAPVDGFDDIGMVCLLAAWLGGTVHAALITGGAATRLREGP